MPIKDRFKTDYPGVFYIIGDGARGPEKIYYIRYRRDGKIIEEKAGRQFQNDMTPARAAGIRSQRIDKKAPSNKDKRTAERLSKEMEAEKWTVNRLWKAYKEGKPETKSISTEEYRFKKHLEEAFGKKEAADIAQLDVDRLRIALGKTRKPQTVKHILNLLDRIIHYGVKKGLITRGLSFKIQKPVVHNIKTEDLSEDQLRALLSALEAESNVQVRNIMKLALFTGMRRGEIFKLKWDDIDFRRNLITIRDPKGGQDQVIPMNPPARQLLENHPKMKDPRGPMSKNPLVFPSEDGKQRKTIQNPSREIRQRAGLPKDFRPMHGLRHVFASMLASSGQVDMYTLQKLLTHKSPLMTQRYAHLRDEALRRASTLAGNILEHIVHSAAQEVERQEAKGEPQKR